MHEMFCFVNFEKKKMYLVQIFCGVKLSAVSNCPFLPMVSNCPRCQIVLVSNCPVSNCPRCQIVRCQIVLVSNCPPTWAVSNCPRCQIVLVSNCPGTYFSYCCSAYCWIPLHWLHRCLSGGLQGRSVLQCIAGECSDMNGLHWAAAGRGRRVGHFSCIFHSPCRSRHLLNFSSAMILRFCNSKMKSIFSSSFRETGIANDS